MNKSQVAKKNQQAQEIPSLLLPLHNRTLLVPTVTVAEMVPVAPYTQEAEGPDWLLGYFPWRGCDVPLLSFERLSGSSDAEMIASGRVAVLNNTGVSNELPFIAIPTVGIPRMSRVAPDDIIEDTTAPKQPYELMRVKVGMEELSIPDVAALERTYLSYHNSR